jgi:TonB-linked SusC/RagA family outer membrane protein
LFLAFILGLPAAVGGEVPGGGPEPGTADAAPGRIVGQVVDQADGSPLGTVQVYIPGTGLGTLTDDDGRYIIADVPPGLYRVEARRIGYALSHRENVRVPDGGTVQVDFQMGITALSLDALVVTGVADPTSARRVPFTVSRLGPESFQVPAAANALTSITGKIAGASVISDAQPGAGVNIVLRSPTSISKSNYPLIVVDGVILASTFGRSSADLESLDIERIEVVKGAAAASLYGSRASNGVIQIWTRRGSGVGEEERTHVSVRTEYGRNQLNRGIGLATHHYFLTNASGQYVDANGTVVDREDRVARDAAERFLDIRYSDPLYDHIDQFFNAGDYTSNSVNLSRSSHTTNFFASFTNRKESGVVLDHGGFEMNSFRLNLDHHLGTNLRFQFSGFHSRSDRDNLPGDTFFDLVQQAPDADLLEPDPDGTPYIWQPDPLGVTPNPLYDLSVRLDDEQRSRTLASTDLRWSPIGWLDVEGNVSYDQSDRLQRLYFPRGMQTDIASWVDGIIRRGSGLTTAINGSFSANARGLVGDFALHGTARYLVEREDYEFFEAEAAGLTVGDVDDLNAGSIPNVTGSTQDIRAQGYFLIGGLDYQGKYIADALIRRDGSSLFGPEERWHTYYRLSGAWRMAEEPWWSFDAIDEFKLRYSMGTAGGRPSYADRFETYSFGEAGALEKATLGNRFLKPERAREQEFGLDMVFNNRVQVQLSHARVRTEDQLVLIPLPAAFGFSSQWQNAGTVEGTSWEASVEASVLRRTDLRWSLGFVVDRSRNEIKEFDRSCFRTGTDNAFYRCAGETLGVMYGNRFLTSASQLPAGTDASEFMVNDEGLLVWVGTGGDWRQAAWGTTGTVNDVEYKWGHPILDYDENGVPTVSRIGDSNPDAHLGFSSSLEWKRVSLAALLDAQIGGNVYNRTNQRMYQYFRSADTDQAGRADELKKTTDYYLALYGANLINSRFVEPADYVKLREVSLRYNVPVANISPLERAGVEYLSVFAIGRNLFTFSDYKGYDPEVGSPLERIDSYAYPRFRTLTMGAEIRF